MNEITELKITPEVQKELLRLANENRNVPHGMRNEIWFKVTSGVYKGSIGEVWFFYPGTGLNLHLPEDKKAYIPTKNLHWLPDYTGGGVLEYNPKKKKLKNYPTDKVGQEVRPGMFVAYVAAKRDRRDCLGLGEVIEVRESGTLRVRPMDVPTSPQGKEEEVRHKNNYVVLSEEQKKGLMLLVLAQEN